MPIVPFKLNQDRRRHIPRQQRKVTNWPAYDASLYQPALIIMIGPVPEADGHDDPRLVDEAVPGVAAVIDDGGVGGEHAARQPVLAQKLPDSSRPGSIRALGRGQETSVRLSGTTRSLVRCHPARSISRTPWAPGATACATSAKCRLMACVSHRGRTRAAPLPSCGKRPDGAGARTLPAAWASCA